MEVQLHAFLSSALDSLCSITPGERAPGGEGVLLGGSGAVLDALNKFEICRPCWESKHKSSVIKAASPVSILAACHLETESNF